MTRVFEAFGLGCCLLALVPAGAALAVELPIRKAGLWEIKMVRAGSPLPEMTMQHCTDAATDHDMNNMVAPMAKQVCSKQDIQQTTTGYVSDSLCNIGGSAITSHSEIVGDFNAAYTVTTTSHIDRAGTQPARDSVTKIEAKWIGACKPDQKPGDIVMPGGGFKLNIKDAEKLKGLLPGAK